MSEPEFVENATSNAAITQLGRSYYDAWVSNTYNEYEMNQLYQIWYYNDTSNDESVRCRFYYKYYSYTTEEYGYWNAYADYDTLTSTYTYDLDSGNAATENDNGLTVDELENLTQFYPTFEPNTASTSGDPHIYPTFGNMYELPQTPGMYRMLQAPGLVLNASTEKLTTKQKNDIAHYCDSHGVLDSMLNSLVLNGVFYDSVYLCADGHSMSFNFNTQCLELSKEASAYFSFGQKRVSETKLYNNAYETCENITQFQVSFEHSIHGKVTIDLNYFSNPQIKYGIGFSAKKANLRNFNGLLIREYKCDSMAVTDLRDIEEKKGIEGKNTVASKFVVIKK